ncbi:MULTISPECIES: glycosyltransferase family 2 protein [unclassified Cryobacterium]|uniref:glycosyltransferase family 2 protein n=1 Tax=unclassified Cryobacterium TaxID=2649013 RepID=UPI0018EB303A|nr:MULTISPECIES: glycosyltransferase family 2 protein [unclassified Cryobacterium]
MHGNPLSPAVCTAVVTVTYNSSAALGAFLNSVIVSEPTPPSVTIADNLSADIDECRKIAGDYGATVLSLGRNLGYGGAINAAVRSVPLPFEFVLVSNPDVLVHPGAISALEDVMRANPQAATVGPRVLNSDGTTYPSARRIPSLRTGVGHAVFSRIWPSNPWTRSYRSENETGTEIRPVGWLSGACLLIRRSAFDDIGGFDQAFFMYFEDVDLGYRLGKAGWQNLYVPGAIVTHTGAHSTSTDSLRMVAAHHESAYLFLARKYRSWYLAPVRWVLRGTLSIRSWWATRG